MKLQLALFAATALASPIIDARGYPGGGKGGGGGNPPPPPPPPPGYGSCPKGSQYNCQANGLINILTCSNILSGNSIGVPILLKRDEVEAATDIEARGGYPGPPHKGSGWQGPTCCSASGFINILTCSNIASGNVFGLPLIL